MGVENRRKSVIFKKKKKKNTIAYFSKNEET